MEEEIELIEEDLWQMRDRVSKLEEIFAKLAKRFKLNFNPRPRQQNIRNNGASSNERQNSQNDARSPSSAAGSENSGSGVAEPESNDLGVIVIPLIPPSTAINTENDECQLNSDHGRDSAVQDNSQIAGSCLGGGNDGGAVDQESYNDLGVTSAPIHADNDNNEVGQIQDHESNERDSSVEDDSLNRSDCLDERQNEETMPSPTSGDEVTEESNDLGVTSPSPSIMNEDDEFSGCNVVDENISSEEDISSISTGLETATTVQKQKKGSSPKEKSTTATKSSSFGLKSVSVSIKRLSFAEIISIKKKMALKSKQWKCPICPKIFTCKSNLRRHLFIHTDKQSFRCPHCPVALKHKRSLRSHIRRAHPKENQNLLPCGICHEKFPSLKILTKHKKKHLKCYFCSRKFRTFQQLQRHLATHTRETPLKCPHCRYATVEKRDLKKHAERLHQQKNFNCEICQTKFKLKKSLRIHVKTHKNYKFRCYFCSELFPSENKLRKHLVIHTGEYPPNSTPSNKQRFRQTYNYFVA